MRAILFLFLFSIFVGSAPDISMFPETQERIIEFIRLRLAESSGRKYVRSKLGAIGTYQITWICLKDYNNRKGTKYKLHHMFEESEAAFVAGDYLEMSRIYFIKYNGDPIYDPLVYSSYNIGRNGSIKIWRGRKVYRIYLRYIGSILSPEKMKAFEDTYIWIYSETDKIKYFVKREGFLSVLYKL